MPPSEAASKPVTILLADDDEEDRMLIRDALQDSGLCEQMRFVTDGQDLMDYLRRGGRYADPSVDAPRPGVILLDLQMPRMDGREALDELKSDISLREIPVTVLSTSDRDADVADSYARGASSFITKSVTFDGLVEVMRAWRRYWFDVVELPR
ncbi:MAG: response regulator [Solirubrobacterales bacterium]|nr:response regulator [Solirubrobacterales bacterium]MBV9471451.1 response regulator [Solirubrobacterales bacterium]